MANSPLGFPFGFYVADNSPIDGKYGIIAAGVWRPYNDVAEALATLPAGARYIGLTVNIANVEYWWKDGVTDPDLVIKTAGGGGSFWPLGGAAALSAEVNLDITSHGVTFNSDGSVDYLSSYAIRSDGLEISQENSVEQMNLSLNSSEFQVEMAENSPNPYARSASYNLNSSKSQFSIVEYDGISEDWRAEFFLNGEQATMGKPAHSAWIRNTRNYQNPNTHTGLSEIMVEENRILLTSHGAGNISKVQLTRQSLEYLADQSANFIPLSIPHVQWVLDQIAASGGGITNSAAANELMMSDGTNAVPSGLFSAGLGHITFGTGASGNTRTLIADGSSANVGFYFQTKGSGGFTFLSEGPFGVLSTGAGIVLSSEGANIRLQRNTAVTNAVSYAAQLQHNTTGTPANGIGTGLEFITETSASNDEVGATIEAVTTDVTPASEDFDLVFKTMAGGAAASERMRIRSDGRVSNISDPTAAQDAATKAYVDANAGGITNTAAVNELMKSDGIGAVGSGLFNPSTGVYNLGTGLSGSTITLQADGSGTDVALFLKSKGSSGLVLQTGIAGDIFFDSYIGTIFLGSSTNVSGARNFTAIGIQSNISFNFTSKGLGKFNFITDTDLTNTVNTGLSILHRTTNTPANGIGTGLEFITETSASNDEVGATIEAITTDVTPASEDFDLVFKTMAGGAAAAERMRIRSDGRVSNISDPTAAQDAATKAYVDANAGGIANTAAANELMKSDGTNAVPSGIFNPSAGVYNLGDDATTGFSSVISALSNDGSASLTLQAQTNVNIRAGQAGTGSLISVLTTSSSTNTPITVLDVNAQSSGTPAVGMATRILFSTGTSVSNTEQGSSIESVTTDVTPGSEDFDLVFKTMASGAAAAERVRINGKGLGIGLTPTARLTLAAGTAAPNTSPLKLTSGTALTTPEDGAIEYHASHLYFTIGSTRYQLDQQGGGGGITNTAAVNELMKSDGTNATTSGIFSTAAGNIVLGTGLSGSARVITADGTGSSVGLYLGSKGTAGVIVETDTGNFSIRGENASKGITWNRASNAFGFNSGSSSSNGTLHGADGYLNISTNTIGRDLVIRAGNANSGGTGLANGGNLYLMYGQKSFQGGSDGNIGIFTQAGSFGSGERVVFIGNSSSVPSTLVSGGGVMFVKPADGKPYWWTGTTEFPMTGSVGLDLNSTIVSLGSGRSDTLVKPDQGVSHITFKTDSVNGVVRISRAGDGEQIPFLVLGSETDSLMQEFSITTQGDNGIDGVKIGQGVIKLAATGIVFNDEQNTLSGTGYVPETGRVHISPGTGTLQFSIDGQLRAANGVSTNINGRSISLTSGNAFTATGNGNGGNIIVTTGQRRTAGAGVDGNLNIDTKNGNISLFNASGSFGSGQRVLFMGNAITIPAANPTGGGILYVENGALKYRGSSGTVTTIANA